MEENAKIENLKNKINTQAQEHRAAKSNIQDRIFELKNGNYYHNQGDTRDGCSRYLLLSAIFFKDKRYLFISLSGTVKVQYQ